MNGSVGKNASNNDLVIESTNIGKPCSIFAHAAQPMATHDPFLAGVVRTYLGVEVSQKNFDISSGRCS